MIITQTRGQLCLALCRGAVEAALPAFPEHSLQNRPCLLSSSCATSPQVLKHLHKVRTTIIGFNGQRGKLRLQKQKLFPKATQWGMSKAGLSPKASSDAGFRGPRLSFHPIGQLWQAPTSLRACLPLQPDSAPKRWEGLLISTKVTSGH